MRRIGFEISGANDRCVDHLNLKIYSSNLNVGKEHLPKLNGAVLSFDQV